MTTPDAEGMEDPVSALLDNIDAYFAKGSKDAISEDARSYINHIIDDVCLLALADGSTLDASAENIWESLVLTIDTVGLMW